MGSESDETEDKVRLGNPQRKSIHNSPPQRPITITYQCSRDFSNNFEKLKFLEIRGIDNVTLESTLIFIIIYQL